MINEENISYIVRGKGSITRLLLTYEIATVCIFIIYQVKQENTKYISVFNYLLINNS